MSAGDEHAAMRFSIWPSTRQPWDEILELTRHCEATAWDGVYFADHFMPHGDFTPDVDPAAALDGDTLECWSVLAALSVAVPRLRLGSLVSSVTFRHPALIANIAAAVDNISHGRLLLGIGAGWQLNEHVAYGIELGSPSERLDRFEEACAMISSLLRERRTTFIGDYYCVRDAPNQPSPVQHRLPLLIGGGGEQRTMRIAARYADEWNSWSTPAVLAHKVQVLHRHCEAMGRDPTELRVSTQALLFISTDPQWVAKHRALEMKQAIVGTPSEITDVIGQYRDAGADEFIVPASTFGSVALGKDTCDLFIEEVAASFRS